MATTEARSAQNTYIETGDGASPETFTEWAEVKSIGGLKATAEELDATHLRSPGAYREFVPSFKNGEDIPIVMNFVGNEASQQALHTEFNSTPPPTKTRRVTFPDGSTCTFQAWVKSVGTEQASVGAILDLGVTLRQVGPPTWDFAA